MIRFFDLFFSLIGFIILIPLFIVISIIIPISSRGGIFYLQSRVGKGNKDFRLIKFRSMATGADQKGGLTIGMHDPRITRIGRFLRKFKLDELPQLINVLKGDMSLVGPRPEIRKYVDLYTMEQKKILAVRPGITDYASVIYFNENEILGHATDPEKTYIGEIMKAKIYLNMQFIDHPTIKNYFLILGKTLHRLAGYGRREQ
ncbi:MAG: sugar transferase [Bacteroidales bacterium]|nr:sugar transferase [Bacteroidales bacterium]